MSCSDRMWLASETKHRESSRDELSSHPRRKCEKQLLIPCTAEMRISAHITIANKYDSSWIIDWEWCIVCCLPAVQYLLVNGLPTFLWMLGNLIHLLRSRDFNTYPQHNTRLNNHLRVDAWLILILALILLAFPRQLLSLTVRHFVFTLSCSSDGCRVSYLFDFFIAMCELN